jgi:hypothetical protein
VTLVRRAGEVLDDERHCVACDTYAVAEQFQTTLPGRVDDLRAQARAFARLAEEKTAEADALEAEIDTAEPHAFLCGGCKAALPRELRGPWSPVGAWSTGMPMGGRLADAPGSRTEAEIVARTRHALEIKHYYEPAPAGA